MFSITKEIAFCFGHRLMNYKGKCNHIHGHNGKVVVTLSSETLDAMGMVEDFGRVKRTIGHWIDESLDHRLLLHEDDPLAPGLMNAGEPIVLMPDNPTTENIAKMIYEYAAKEGFPVTEVTLWETPTSYATYRG